MAGEILYIKAERDVEVNKEAVFLSDIAKMTCTDKHVLNRAKALKVFQFHEDKEKRQVICILKVIEKLQEIYPTLTVENLGETDILLEYVAPRSKMQFSAVLKIIFVSFVSLLGTAFTIMAFHNDIGINDLFSKLYEMIMGKPSSGYTLLEVSYSIGLAVGIIVFFNHIGGRRITKDPTPIEVAMKTYEDDVNTTLIDTWNREGKSIDVN